MGRRSEMLLYMAARAQLVDEVIRPALAEGKVVVADRFVLANIVYQGHAGGLDPQSVRAVGNVAVDGCVPTCVFLLDMEPHAAAARLARPLDRMENQGIEYRARLRAGFLAEAAIDPALTRDLYVALGEPLGGDGAWAVRMYVKPFIRCIWLGALMMMLGGFIAAGDRRFRRELAADPESQEPASLPAGTPVGALA